MIIYQNIDNDLHNGLNINNISVNSDDILPLPEKRRRTYQAIVPEIVSYGNRFQILDRLTPVENIQPTIPENFSLIQKIYIIQNMSLE